MSGAYLPVLPEVRDRANAYLAGMAARGFVPIWPIDELVRRCSVPDPNDQAAKP